MKRDEILNSQAFSELEEELENELRKEEIT
jgi:hypothetical protein